MDLDKEEFVRAAEMTSRYFVCYLVKDLNCLGFIPKIEIEAVLYDNPSGNLHSWKIDLTKMKFRENDNDQSLFQLARTGRIDPFPVRPDPLRTLMRLLTQIKNETNSTIDTHWDVNFRICDKSKKSKELGIVQCRIFILPRRGGRELEAWCPNKGQYLPISEIWSSVNDGKKSRFQCYWKGQCLYNFNIDKLYFLSEVEKKERAHIVGILQFGAVVVTDPTKRAFGDEVINLLNPTPLQMKNQYDITHNFPKSQTYPGRIGTKFATWYYEAKKKYDQTVQVEWNTERTKIIRVIRDNKRYCIDTNVYFEESKPFPLMIGEKSKKMKKVLCKIIRFEMQSSFLSREFVPIDRTTFSDVQVVVQRFPSQYFDVQQWQKSIFDLENDETLVSNLLKEIEKSAPKMLQLEFVASNSVANENIPSRKASKQRASTTTTTTKSAITSSSSRGGESIVLNWHIGSKKNPNLRLYVSNSANHKVIGWHKKISSATDESHKLIPLLDHALEKNFVDRYHRIPWRKYGPHNTGTVIATVTGCVDVDQDRTYFEYPSDWIEKHILIHGIGRYRIEFGICAWSNMGEEASNHKQLIAPLTFSIKCEAGDPIDITHHKVEDFATHQAIDCVRAGDQVLLTFISIDMHKNLLEYDTISASKDFQVQVKSSMMKKGNIKWNKVRKVFELPLRINDEVTSGDIYIYFTVLSGERMCKKKELKLKLLPPQPRKLQIISSVQNDTEENSSASSNLCIENHTSLNSIALGFLDKHNNPTSPGEDHWQAKVSPITSMLDLEGHLHFDLRNDTAQFSLEGILVDLDTSQNEQSDGRARRKKISRKKQKIKKRRAIVLPKESYDVALRISCYDGSNKEVLSPLIIDFKILPSKQPHFLRIFKKIDENITMLDENDANEEVWIDGNFTYGTVASDEDSQVVELKEAAGSKISGLLVKQYDEAGREILFARDRILKLTIKHSNNLNQSSDDDDEQIFQIDPNDLFQISMPRSGQIHVLFEIDSKDKMDDDSTDDDDDNDDPYLRSLSVLIHAVASGAKSFIVESGPELYRCGQSLERHGLLISAQDEFENKVYEEDKSKALMLHLSLEENDDSINFGFKNNQSSASSLTNDKEIQLFWDGQKHGYTTDTSIIGAINTRLILSLTHQGDNENILDQWTLVLAAGLCHSLEFLDGIKLDHSGLYKKGFSVCAVDRAGNPCILSNGFSFVGGSKKSEKFTLTLELIGEYGKFYPYNATRSNFNHTSLKATLKEDKFNFQPFWIWGDPGETIKLKFELKGILGSLIHAITPFTIPSDVSRPTSYQIRLPESKIVVGSEAEPFHIQIFDQKGALIKYSLPRSESVDESLNEESGGVADDDDDELMFPVSNDENILRPQLELDLSQARFEVLIRPSNVLQGMLEQDKNNAYISIQEKDPNGKKNTSILHRAGTYDIVMRLSQNKARGLLRDIIPYSLIKPIEATRKFHIAAGPPVQLAIQGKTALEKNLDLGPFDWNLITKWNDYPIASDLWLRAHDEFGNVVEPDCDFSDLHLEYEWPQQNSIELFYGLHNDKKANPKKFQAKNGFLTTPNPSGFRYSLFIKRPRVHEKEINCPTTFTLKFRAEQCSPAQVNIKVVDFKSHEASKEIQKKEAEESLKLLSQRKTDIEREYNSIQIRMDSFIDEISKIYTNLSTDIQQNICNKLQHASHHVDLRIGKKMFAQALFSANTQHYQQELIALHENTHDDEHFLSSPTTYTTTTRHAPWKFPDYQDTRIVGKIHELFVVQNDEHAKYLAWHLGRAMDLLITKDEQSGEEYARTDQQTKPITTYYLGTMSSYKTGPHDKIADPQRKNAAKIWEKSKAILASDCVELVIDSVNTQTMKTAIFGKIILFDDNKDAVTRYRECFSRYGGLRYTCISMQDGYCVRNEGTRGGSDYHYQFKKDRLQFHALQPVNKSSNYNYLKQMCELIRETDLKEMKHNFDNFGVQLQRIKAQIEDARSKLDATKKSSRSAIQQESQPPTKRPRTLHL
uniref:Uncharacterized protein n=1 Tax=Aureoumbra lagunensis TaxID=44058 RepID=A0A7S3NIN3_9STRA